MKFKDWWSRHAINDADYETDLGKLYHSSCEDIMKQLPEDSIDFIFTDPPYGLKFMGKKWDYDVPSVDTFKIMLDVVKPGATMFCFAGSRTQHRMAVNIENAGWILKDCIMWIYGSGFPKATDISKQIDKMCGTERKIIGKNSNDRKNRNNTLSEYGLQGGVGNSNITQPATPEVKLWNGWKSHGLKPAYEPIIVAMKPNEGSYADNALKHGVAGLNIDGGRIKRDPQDRSGWSQSGSKGSENRSMAGKNYSRKAKLDNQNRYPANIILDEEAAEMLDEQSGELKSGALLKHHNQNEFENNCMSGKNYKRNPKKDFNASKGGASRFFYCAKASKSERNAGLSGDKEKRDDSRSYGQAGTDNPYNRGAQEVTNHHPTVKPLKLIKYLLTLLKTPTGGTCLDCFAGSGSTLVACENMGINYIGIEREEKYCVIAKVRIENERKQLKMF